MKLHQIGPNQTEITKHGGLVIFFSYETPVALFVPRDGCCYRTKQFYSVTTSKHINRWIDGRNTIEVPQDFINARAECN